jgi:uncharacterized repeat protein (TIGR01451 family)
MTATNTGNVELTNVNFTRRSFADITSCSQPTPAVLSPGASLTCTVEQIVDMAKIAAGGVVVNDWAVSGVYQGTVKSTTAAYRTPIADRPAITIVKTSTSHPDADGDGVADSPLTSPSTIDYTLTVTNTGNVALTDLDVRDPDLVGLTCGSGIPTFIAPGASFTCTGSQSVSQSDIEAGSDLINTATAEGRGGGHTAKDGDTYDIPIRRIVSISATKSSTSHPDKDKDGVADRSAQLGETIDYVVGVTNTGNVDVDVAVSDPLTTLTCDLDRVPVGQSTDCRGSYTVTEKDITKAVPIRNTATVTATGPGGLTDRTTASYLVPVLGRSELVVRKVSTSHPDADGDGVADRPADAPGLITFEIEIENTGTTTIDDIDVGDISGITGCSPSLPFTLAPTEVATCTSSVTVSQTDFEALPAWVNIAFAAGKDPAGNDVTGADYFIVPFERRQALELTKSARGFADADRNGVADAPISAPQPLTYDLVATNTGNTPLADVEITDADLGPLSCLPAAPAPLAPGKTLSCTGTKSVTQTDIDNGNPIVNAAFVTSGATVFDRVAYVIPVDVRPELSVTKTGAFPYDDRDGNGVSDFPITGPDSVDYVLSARNTGTVTLFDVTITDPKLTSLKCGGTGITLLPGELLTCDYVNDATYYVSQPEIDAGGEILNTATATATDVHGDPVAGLAVYEIPITQTSALRLTKSAQGFTDADSNSVADAPISAPQPLTYDLVATNTGNTTLLDVEITDADLGPLSCLPAAPAPLAPGETLSCTGTKSVTQTDIDNGNPIVNAAFVTSGGTVFDRAAYVINVARSPKMSVTKTSPSHPDGDGDGIADAPISGAGPVDYRIEVTNTGNTTLTGVVIDDPLLPGCTAFQAGNLAPGATATCTATFDVTQQVVDAGGDLFNTASATATAGGRTLKDQDTYDIPIARRPELTATKTAAAPFDDGDADGRSDASAVADDDIEYVVTVTNTGNVTIDAINAADTITTLICAQDTLAPGDFTTCTGTYRVTQGDVDARVPLRNLATISGSSPTGQPVGAAAAYLVPVLDVPEILVRKSIPANPDGDGDFVGDTPLTGPTRIDYEIEVANGGTVSLTGVEVADTLLTTVDCPRPTPFDLAVGDAVTCTGSLDVTQAMFDAEPGLVNVAVAAGTAPGDVTVAGGWVAAVQFDHRPELTLVKSSTSHPDKDKNGVADTPISAPTTITYQLVATNTGNVTLTDVSVTDPLLPALGCGPAKLAPGEQLTCTGDLVVDQGDIDAGGDVLNTATATGTYGGSTASDRSTYDVPISASAVLELEKTSTTHPDADGDGVADRPADAPGAVTYRLTATNTGTTTLTGVEIADPDLPTLSCSPAAPATLAPGESMVCTGSGRVDQVDLDGSGDVVNVATATARTSTGSKLTVDADYTIPLERRPDIRLSKTPAEQRFVVGTQAVVSWTITVSNTGNVTLTGLDFTDGIVDDADGTVDAVPGCTLPLADLAPGASTSVTCSVGRTISTVEFANLAVVDAQSAAGPVALGAVAVVSSQAATTAPPSTTTPALPSTGSSPWRTASIAMLMVAAGVAAVATTRLRRRLT